MQASLEQYSSLLPAANEDACLRHQPIRDETPIWGGRGGPRSFFLIPWLFYWLVRSPCKNLKSYDNPLNPKFQNHTTTFEMFTWQQFSIITGQCTHLAPTNSSQRQRMHFALTNLFYPEYFSTTSYYLSCINLNLVNMLYAIPNLSLSLITAFK